MHTHTVWSLYELSQFISTQYRDWLTYVIFTNFICKRITKLTLIYALQQLWFLFFSLLSELAVFCDMEFTMHDCHAMRFVFQKPNQHEFRCCKCNLKIDTYSSGMLSTGEKKQTTNDGCRIVCDVDVPSWKTEIHEVCVCYARRGSHFEYWNSHSLTAHSLFFL